MADMETHDLPHDAVLWPWLRNGTDSEPVLGAPVQLKVRWTPAKSMGRSRESDDVQIDVTAVVDRDVPQHSIMWKGKLADYAEPADLYQVVRFTPVEDIRGRVTARTVSLGRFRSALPNG